MIINGDALTVLKRMDSESVHMAVTSSPYFGLRSYGTEPQIWDGDPNCQHEWGTVHPPGYRSSDTKPGPLQNEGNTNRQNLKSDVCIRCGAWRGELGSEPSPELFVRHITTICHELKRVLRNDGTFFYNIGDSYARNPQKGGSGTPTDKNNRGEKYQGSGISSDLKEKDLIGIPWAIAFSLRADGAASPQTMYTVERIRSALLNDYDTWNDVPKNTKRTIEDLDEEWAKAHKGGWYLRADLPWLKRNSLPSSVTDRPSSSIEHVFLFSKSGDTKFWTHPTKCGTRKQPPPDYIYTNKATGEITQTPPQDWKDIMYVKEGETKESNLWKRRNLWDGHDYFYDHVATMQPSSESYNKDKRPRGKLRQTVNANSKYPDEGQFKKVNTLPCGSSGEIIFKKQDGTGNPTTTGFNARWAAKNLQEKGQSVRLMHVARATGEEEYNETPGLRFMRDSDFFFKTWQGLLHNENGEPMALVVNPRGYKGCHFAAFPVHLVSPLILAGTSDHGVCPHCGAPWTRNINKTSTTAHDGKTSCDYEVGSAANRLALLRQRARENGEEYSTTVQTTGWSPSCSCEDNIPVPAMVLDPFGGSSATGVACKLHNRNYVGIELNPEYCKLGEQRVRDGK